MFRLGRVTSVVAQGSRRTVGFQVPKAQFKPISGHRFASRYAHQHISNSGRRSYTKTMLVILGGLGVTLGGLWWFYWPHHTFSTNVAKILRKGLWAESEKGGYDYQTALKYYLEALEKAQSENLDNLSDEYTGIQLKIGEMYERLGMTQDALMIYTEIASAYLVALTTLNKVPNELRPHLIQKDLRVIIKCVELNRSNPQMCKMMLMTHFLVAQEEVAKRSAYTSKLIAKERIIGTDDKVTQIEKNLEEKETIQEEFIDPNEELILKKNKEPWLPFRDELFNARDLYVAICLATGDLSSAVRAKTATTEWMLNADCNPGEILMSQTNLGSIMYLQAEEFEAKEYSAIKSSLAEEEINQLRKAKEHCVKLSIKCYESVLDFAKKLPANLRREDNVEESIALSTYGLGVVKLHLGELDGAKNLLRESRLRAKGAGFEDLALEAERELQRLTSELEKATKEGMFNDKKFANDTERIKAMLENVEKQPDIELDVQLVKHGK